MGSGKVLMVTSLLENEGKSTLAVNMALAMAQKKKRVLLVDCDLRKPACHILLEQEEINFGTRDVLEDSTKLSKALMRYKHTDLFLLLEKHSASNGGDLVSGDSMKALMDWARNEFDFVVLDLPPMSIASDAESVADIADTSLLVVRQNSAGASGINKAIAQLEKGKARMLGCVLNNVYSTFLSSGQGYHYGGYGRYGHYGSYDEKTSGK
jgi:capsular exopolysaccharide synthesis family protein